MQPLPVALWPVQGPPVHCVAARPTPVRLARRLALPAITLLLPLLLVLAGCGPLHSVPTPTAAPAASIAPDTPAATSSLRNSAGRVPLAPGELARQHLVSLSKDIGPRVAGTSGETRAAAYIQAVFADLGYEPLAQTFSFDGKQSANIVTVHAGRSPQEILVGAHYDSVDVGRGADDNASGVAVMLEVAADLAAAETPYTLRFVAFGAEEVGMEGSDHYTRQMGHDAVRNTVLMVNLDSLVAGDLAYVYGDAGDAGVARDWCLSWAAGHGLDLRTQMGDNDEYLAGTTGDWSDHVAFKKRGIPYVYFESTNWALGEGDGFTQVDPGYGENGFIWHTPFDNLDYLEESFPGRAQSRLELFVTVLYHLLTEFQPGPR